MQNRSVRILDFDSSVTSQKALVSDPGIEVIDLRDIGPAARYYADNDTRRILKSRIPASKNTITFLGSGDFHHITALLLAAYDEPISLIDFDFHPDWERMSLFLTCGSWINEALASDGVRKAVLIGASSNDLSTMRLQTGNINLFKDDRLEIYPYSHRPSLALFRDVPKNISLRTKRGMLGTKICWNELKGKRLSEFFLSIINRIPTGKVYISIDKDCLKKDYAVTNWEEGPFSLDELISMLKIIGDHKEIVGADISGDYSRPRVKGTLKNALSRIDHPGRIAADDMDEPSITEINESTNLRILQAL